STQAPPEGTTSGGAEDLDKLTALSSLVSTLVQKVNTQESELNAHKLLFKEVVGKLVKKVKLLEDKLKGRKRKFVLTDSDKEEDAEQDVDPLIKLAKAAATAAAASAVPTGGSHEADIPPSSSVPTDEFAGGSDVPAGATTGPSADPSNKGKSPLVEEDPPVRERTFRQREEDRLGEEAARRMYEEEQAELEREREEMQKKRQQDVLNSAKYYTDSDWTDIMGQVHANQGLTADLLGPDVTEDNFAERMVALIAKRRREFAVQRFKDKLNKPMTYAQQKAFMRTFGFQRDGSPKARASPKKLKTGSDDVNLVATSHGVPQEEAGATHSLNVSQEEVAATSHSQDIPDAPAIAPSTTTSIAHQTASSTKKVGTRRKRFGRKGVHPSRSTIPIKDGDPKAEHKMSIKYASDADSASDDNTPVNLHGVVDWELLPTGLGWVIIIYRKDNSRKCFSRLREILYLVTRTDLMVIYGRVMTFYQDRKAMGVGLVLWGDLKVLIDSPEVNDGSDVWKNQHTWIIQSWRLYSSTGIHVLETVSGLVLHMFVDKRYPQSVNLIERMLDHQLEICRDTVGNELTTAVQLIAFLKKQISDSRRPKLVVHMASPEQTATGKDTSNPFMAVLTCQKSYSSSTYYDSCSKSGKWFQSSMDLTLSGPQLDADFLVADSKFLKVAFGVGFKMIAVPSSGIVITSRYVVPTGRVKVPASRYVVPTGKDNVIVSAGRTKLFLLFMVSENENTPATVREQTYTDVTDEEKIRKSVDIKATNIVLQGPTQDIYNLVNHNEHAKQIWDRVKLLIQGLELSLQEHESRLYDDFDMFTSTPGESIHSYYIRFA
ncbi:hypothetical protein Tco_1064187, partial [Tanacetum coccineum]